MGASFVASRLLSVRSIGAVEVRDMVLSSAGTAVAQPIAREFAPNLMKALSRSCIPRSPSLCK